MGKQLSSSLHRSPKCMEHFISLWNWQILFIYLLKKNTFWCTSRTFLWFPGCHPPWWRSSTTTPCHQAPAVDERVCGANDSIVFHLYFTVTYVSAAPATLKKPPAWLWLKLLGGSAMNFNAKELGGSANFLCTGSLADFYGKSRHTKHAHTYINFAAG